MLDRSLTVLLLAAALGALVPTGACAQIYVDKDSPSGGDGTSWANAYNTLQEGLTAATSGDQVWVAEGTYYPDNGGNATADSREATFALPDGAAVIGGFEGYGEAEEQSLSGRPNRFSSATVTLSGEIQQDGDPSNNAYHVAVSRSDGSATQLRRVRIAGGNANGRGEKTTGGGLFLDDTQAKIINCYVQQNRAKRGAGIGIKGGSPGLQGVLVNANDASIAGGGIYDYGSAGAVAYVTIADNEAPSGGGTFKLGSSADYAGSAAQDNTGDNKAAEPLSTTTITLTTTVVGNDLYTDSDGDGLGYDDISFSPENGQLDELTVTAGPVQKTVDMSGGSGSMTVPTTSDVSQVRLTQSDPDFIQTWVMNNTATEQAPDLRQSSFSSFPDEPDHQSNYGASASTAGNVISLATSNLSASYEARVIPTTSPEGKDVIDRYRPQINSSNTARWTELEGYDEVLGIVVTERLDNQNDLSQSQIDEMYNIFQEVKAQTPIPIEITKENFNKTSNIVQGRGLNYIYTGVEDGTPSHNFNVSNGYGEDGTSDYESSESKGTMRSEIYGSVTGFDDSNGTNVGEDISSDGVTFNEDAEFLPRILYSVFSESGI